MRRPSVGRSRKPSASNAAAAAGRGARGRAWPSHRRWPIQQASRPAPALRAAPAPSRGRHGPVTVLRCRRRIESALIAILLVSRLIQREGPVATRSSTPLRSSVGAPGGLHDAIEREELGQGELAGHRHRIISSLGSGTARLYPSVERRSGESTGAILAPVPDSAGSFLSRAQPFKVTGSSTSPGI